jgi:hypothetical protein
VFAFGLSLAANLVTNWSTGSGVFWDAHKWPLAVSLLISALACWFLGLRFQNRKSRVLRDVETGQEIVVKESHTLFFVPMLWWAPILAAIGVIILGTEFIY